MVSRCARCGNPAATFMSYDYAERAVWLEDLTRATAEAGHPLCVDHADRLTPPMGWTLTDRRSVTPLFVRRSLNRRSWVWTGFIDAVRASTTTNSGAS